MDDLAYFFVTCKNFRKYFTFYKHKHKKTFNIKQRICLHSLTLCCLESIELYSRNMNDVCNKICRWALLLLIWYQTIPLFINTVLCKTYFYVFIHGLYTLTDFNSLHRRVGMSIRFFVCVHFKQSIIRMKKRYQLLYRFVAHVNQHVEIRIVKSMNLKLNWWNCKYVGSQVMIFNVYRSCGTKSMSLAFLGINWTKIPQFRWNIWNNIFVVFPLIISFLKNILTWNGIHRHIVDTFGIFCILLILFNSILIECCLHWKCKVQNGIVPNKLYIKFIIMQQTIAVCTLKQMIW